MDRLTSMAVFVCVAERGSFAAAGAALRLSGTMVANHVAALERHLGATLIHRTTRRHALTAVGTAYLERCRDVLASVAAADRVADQLTAEPSGLLRVTAPVSYGVHRLTPLLRAYQQRYPAVQVALNLNDRLVDLEEEGYDLAIRSGTPAPDCPLVARLLQTSRMRIAASADYLARHGTPAHPQDLASHNVLGFAAWGDAPQLRFSRDGETVCLPFKPGLTINNGQALLVAALAGHGIVVQADVLLDEPIATGLLQPLLPGWTLPQRPVYVMRKPDRVPGARVRSFVDFLVAALAGAQATE
ncbi:LysR family transcriptional regulator [Chitiniphilus purpureus]|uniref:LysR family transcriptional regulator n=1 Tax=Chitiniphilus purpureus TaxID=2981137 RepID=A0ABY6DMP1_9NEIS|nr:LysR family transcriptional regulator [Chitiniphilus sp. CD1]UXY14963.1 LysR family transcriptional regulator [Chitiniphilus sp. CD1]